MRSKLRASIVVAVVALMVRGSPAVAQDAAGAIRSARKAQNDALAAHQLDSAATFWADDVVITAGLGRVLRGKDAYQRAFSLDTGVVYVRVPEQVETGDPWLNAWEEGHWVGRQGAAGPVLIHGRYAAQWQRIKERWVIRSEVFVALGCSGAACRWPLVPR